MLEEKERRRWKGNVITRKMSRKMSRGKIGKKEWVSCLFMYVPVFNVACAKFPGFHFLVFCVNLIKPCNDSIE